MLIYEISIKYHKIQNHNKICTIWYEILFLKIKKRKWIWHKLYDFLTSKFYRVIVLELFWNLYFKGPEITKSISKLLDTRFGKLIDEKEEDTDGSIGTERLK